MKLRALMMALALAACGPANQAPPAPDVPEAPDPWVMHIEIGRYGAMLGQVRDLTEERPGANELETTDPNALARNLREVVWRYNLERSRLCGQGLLTEVACGPAYEPGWITETLDSAPTLEVLRERQAGVETEVMRFWDAVCADARARAPEAERGDICAIE